MKYVSFKWFVIGILLPPVLYIFTVQGLQKYLTDHFYQKIEEFYVGDTTPLFDGTIRIEDALSHNIDALIRGRRLFTFWGATIDILVTSNGKILYPKEYLKKEPVRGREDFMATARDNFDVLNGGMDLRVALSLPHNTMLSNAILFAYLILSGTALYLYFQAVNKRVDSEETIREEEIKLLHDAERENVKRRVMLEKERSSLSEKIETIRADLNDEKKRASVNEDEMIKEIMTLEEKLEKNAEISFLQQQEISALHEKLAQFEKRVEGKKKRKGEDHTIKRLKALYKQLDLTDRAIDGFIDLTEEMKIKAEEIIRHLNDDTGQVAVKRKVFNRKSDLTFFEVAFAYKGRLYFQKKKEGRVEVLVIGTKNSQTKDLEYLDGL